MDAANLHKSAPMPGPGELVLQNGRQAGARRPLCVPTTFIGRNPDSDVRLNVDGVDPMHSVVIVVKNGIRVRDLGSRVGTYVNGERVEHVALAHGDILTVGPFQFRVELTTSSAFDDSPVDEVRSALRIQASAIAAQQAALEEEEMRLQQRRADLQLQEEQLAAHLAEKQREVQVWSDYTKAEREALRMEKIAQEKDFDRLEQEIRDAREELTKDHQQLDQERQRINKVYQRLRVRWQKQWSAEREKYEKRKDFQADTAALEERRADLARQDAFLKQEKLQFCAEREMATRQMLDARAILRRDQIRWRRRRSLEHAVLRGIERRTDEGRLKLERARQLLVVEKENWDKQLDLLQKELHGLNNRAVHQRLAVHARAEEIARLDVLVGERRVQAGDPPLALPAPDAIDETRTAVDSHDTDQALIVLAEELADQRAQLVEQYKRLTEIQDDWQQQRDHAADELEAVAQQLLAQQQALDQREQHIGADETALQQRQADVEAARQDLLLWRAQLKARDSTFTAEFDKQRLAVAHKDAQLQEQLSHLERLRTRWHEHRQEEIKKLHAMRASVEAESVETQRRRIALFEKVQQLEAEKRTLAERALALEQYQQEIVFRANDPAAQRRIERLRRRWLTSNADLIRNAKTERESARKELQDLETRRAELAEAAQRLEQNQAAFRDQQEMLDEREAILTARQTRVDDEIAKFEGERDLAQDQHLRLQNQIDAFAQAVYDNPDDPPVDQAA